MTAQAQSAQTAPDQMVGLATGVLIVAALITALVAVEKLKDPVVRIVDSFLDKVNDAICNHSY
jgi:hypothetical protein